LDNVPSEGLEVSKQSRSIPLAEAIGVLTRTPLGKPCPIKANDKAFSIAGGSSHHRRQPVKLSCVIGSSCASQLLREHQSPPFSER
jgi:hypothetical protein